jgi:nitrite reductase (NADH) small subunit
MSVDLGTDGSGVIDRTAYERVAGVADFTEGKPLTRMLDGHPIAIFRIDGAYYAINVVCPHQHIPLLAEGPREGLVITCPMHGWSFRLDTGCNVNGSGSVATYRVVVDGADVFVERPPAPAEPMW